jgi:hypothetical protein
VRGSSGDDEDIGILLRESGIQSTQDALEVLKQIYPAQEASAKTRFFLQELLGA